jgi:hypothetical protein
MTQETISPEKIERLLKRLADFKKKKRLSDKEIDKLKGERPEIRVISNSGLWQRLGLRN